MSKASTAIASLNDVFRKSLFDRSLGKTYMTSGVSAFGSLFVARALSAVAAFDTFSADNDPYGEHDFGSFKLDSEKLFWKIDHYSKDDPNFGSEDPSDPLKTARVLTIMLAEEY